MTEDRNSDFTEDERNILIHDIVDVTEKMMQSIITKKSPKNRAKSSCGEYKHSERHLTRDTILVNIMSRNQTLPARPRDFRLKLPMDQKKIEGHGLFDMLQFLVRICILKYKKEEFKFRRGRPRSGSQLSEEIRGRKDSFYQRTDIYQIIDNMLADSTTIEKIDKNLDKEKLYNFLKYSFASHFYEMKFCPEKFLESLKPYEKITEDNKDKYANAPLVLAKDLTPEKINNLAKKYALVTLSNNSYNNKMVYFVSTLLIYGEVYQ